MSSLIKTAAVNMVLTAISGYREINSEIKGNIPIISFKEKDFEGAEHDMLQRLLLEAECLEALRHENVRVRAQRSVLAKYGLNIIIEISDNLAYARLNLE